MIVKTDCLIYDRKLKLGMGGFSLRFRVWQNLYHIDEVLFKRKRFIGGFRRIGNLWVGVPPLKGGFLRNTFLSEKQSRSTR